MNRTERKAVYYLCDGKVENCDKTMCYLRKPLPESCHRTSDIRHAVNFEYVANSYREKTPLDAARNNPTSSDEVTGLP